MLKVLSCEIFGEVELLLKKEEKEVAGEKKSGLDWTAKAELYVLVRDYPVRKRVRKKPHISICNHKCRQAFQAMRV